MAEIIRLRKNSAKTITSKHVSCTYFSFGNQIIMMLSPSQKVKNCQSQNYSSIESFATFLTQTVHLFFQQQNTSSFYHSNIIIIINNAIYGF